MIGYFNSNSLVLFKNFEVENLKDNSFFKLEDDVINLFSDAFILVNNKIEKIKPGKVKIFFEKLIITPKLDENKFINSFVYDDDKFIFFNFLFPKIDFDCKYFATEIESLEKANKFIETYIQNPKILTVFTELFLNAYEHGNLNLNFKLKEELIKNGKYILYLKNSKNNKTIRVCVSKFVYKEKNLIAIKIKDEGNGFKFFERKTLFSGRGIKLSSKYAYIFYNEIGNEVLIIKEVDES